MRQAGNPSSVDKLRMREMSVSRRTFPGKSPARSHSRETLDKTPFNPTTFNFSLFTINHQPSTINYQPSTTSYLFRERTLSIITVAKIKEPPITVLRFGFSFKKTKAIRMPKIGVILVMILAVLTEKCLKLLTSMVWPMAVVNSPSITI